MRAPLLAVAIGLAGCAGAPAPRPPLPVAAQRREPPPPPAEPPPPPPSYEALLAAEEGDREPLAVVPLEAGERALHLVLDADRCYRVVGVAETRLELALVDEHGHPLAARAGRVVRFEGICPRWTGSFELRARLEGLRGRVAVYDDAFRGEGGGATSSTAR